MNCPNCDKDMEPTLVECPHCRYDRVLESAPPAEEFASTDEQEDKWWEVWVKTTRGTWTRSDYFTTKEAAMIHVGTTKSEIAVMEVGVVARTETVVTRKVCSPSAKLKNHL